MEAKEANLKFGKGPEGLLPAVVQDVKTQKVLAVGFMSRKAFKATIKSGEVMFFSVRSNSLETASSNPAVPVRFVSAHTDSDNRSILLKATVDGPIGRAGEGTRFGEENRQEGQLFNLERYVSKRKSKPSKRSSTSRLLARGTTQIAKKLGEEAVELVIEAMKDDPELFKGEAADLLYHLVVLCGSKDIDFEDVLVALSQRRR
ncbi:MAG: phosphoribosyl-ATP diphosphatase [Pyrinomonadaceae bacterium]